MANIWFLDQTVFSQGAAATPVALLTAMTEVGKKKGLKNITVCHMHTEGPAAYTDPSCEGIFRWVNILKRFLPIFCQWPMDSSLDPVL